MIESVKCEETRNIFDILDIQINVGYMCANFNANLCKNYLQIVQNDNFSTRIRPRISFTVTFLNACYNNKKKT